MTNDELAAIEARANAATPGPWMLNPEQYTCDCGPNFDHKGPLDCATGWYDQAAWVDGPACIEQGNDTIGFCNADADFMAHAREDVPALVAEVRQLRSQVAKLQAWKDAVPVDDLYTVCATADIRTRDELRASQVTDEWFKSQEVQP